MKLLSLKSMIFGCMIAATATSSAQPASKSIVDANPVFPSAMVEDNKVHDMMTGWYFARYAVLDSLAKQPVSTTTSDAEYIDRLQSMNTIIEMPFNSVVKQYIEMYANKRPQLIQRMLGLSMYYMPIFEDALARLDLPDELKYLPVIESALNPNAVSKAGAAGLWQFMPSTATGKGLEVNSLVDERRDPLRSSYAAANFLKELYDVFGDWALVLAAYNCGPGNVNKAIKNSGGRRDFWEIYNYLPKETRGYVPAFIAATYIMNHYGKHGIAPTLAREPLITDTVHITNRVHFKQISDVMGVPMEQLRMLNPQYRQDVIPGNVKPYTLILPSVQAFCYRANEDSILAYERRTYEPRVVVEPSTGLSKSQSDLVAENAMQSTLGTDSIGTYTEEVVVKYHTVQRGETLKTIGELYGVSVEAIRADNNLDGGKVKRGQKLKISTTNRSYGAPQASRDVASTASPSTVAPVNTATATAPQASTPKSTPQKKQQQKPKAAKPVTHTVKSGESLDKIARKYGVSVDQLRKSNRIKGDMIHPGQTLTVPTKASSSKSKTPSKKKSSKKSSRRR